MLRCLKTLLGSVIHATDGEIGHVRDFLFDDSCWTIRYLVLDPGGWLSNRHVLISPFAAGQPDWNTQVVPVSLTLEQIRHAPDVDTARPVSRQEEIAMSHHFGWPAYWALDPQSGAELVAEKEVAEERDPYLRSVTEVLSYQVRTVDGDLGTLEDLVMEDANWFLRFIVARTGHVLSAQKVMISTQYVQTIDWASRLITLSRSPAQM